MFLKRLEKRSHKYRSKIIYDPLMSQVDEEVEEQLGSERLQKKDNFQEETTVNTVKT